MSKSQQTSSSSLFMTYSHGLSRYQRLPAQQSIRVFEAAARHLSFTQAAQELSITQSGVSKQIKGLEAFLGVVLFVRENRHIRLTEVGQRFYQRCTEALDCLQQAVDEAQGYRYHLRLQAPPTLTARWLIPRMGMLYQAYPNLDLHIETTWTRRIDDRIHADTNELIIHACPHYPYDDIAKEVIHRETLFMLVSPTYLKQYGDIRSPTDLMNKTLIHTRLDGHFHWEAWCKKMDFDQLDTSQGYEFETLDMALSAAENGIGVIICDVIFALESLQRGRLVIPFNMPKLMGLSYYLMNHHPQNKNTMQNQYCEWLKTQLTQDQQRIDTYLKQHHFNTDTCLDMLT